MPGPIVGDTCATNSARTAQPQPREINLARVRDISEQPAPQPLETIPDRLTQGRYPRGHKVPARGGREHAGQAGEAAVVSHNALAWTGQEADLDRSLPQQRLICVGPPVDERRECLVLERFVAFLAPQPTTRRPNAVYMLWISSAVQPTGHITARPGFAGTAMAGTANALSSPCSRKSTSRATSEHCHSQYAGNELSCDRMEKRRLCGEKDICFWHEISTAPLATGLHAGQQTQRPNWRIVPHGAQCFWLLSLSIARTGAFPFLAQLSSLSHTGTRT